MRISDWSSDVCSSDLANLCRADIPQRPQLPAPGPRTRRRNPRKLARSQPLPQYGRTARAEENRTTQSRMTSTMTANLQNLMHTTGIYVVDNRWLINPGQLSANPDIDKISADYRMRSYPHPLQSEKIGSHQNGEAGTCKYDPDPRERSKARQQSFEPDGHVHSV